MAGDDDKVGGLVPESTDLLGLKIALEDFEDLIASDGSVPETLRRGGAPDGPEAEDHDVVEDSKTGTGSDTPDSLGQGQDSTKSQEASNDPDSVDQAQDSAETRMASDADGQDGVRIFQGSTETEGTSILFDDIEVWFDRI